MIWLLVITIRCDQTYCDLNYRFKCTALLISVPGYRRFDVVPCGWYNTFSVMRWFCGCRELGLAGKSGAPKPAMCGGREEVHAREAAITTYRTTCLV